jgi:hypothetical protein
VPIIQSRHLPSASVAFDQKLDRLIFSKSTLSPPSGRLSKVPGHLHNPLDISIFLSLPLSHPGQHCRSRSRENCGPDFDKVGTSGVPSRFLPLSHDSGAARVSLRPTKSTERYNLCRTGWCSGALRRVCLYYFTVSQRSTPVQSNDAVAPDQHSLATRSNDIPFANRLFLSTGQSLFGTCYCTTHDR